MDFKDLRVLYVEDDEHSRQVFEVMLQRIMKVQELRILADSSDFKAVIEAYSQSPELVFLDVHVQPHNGYAMLKMIQALHSWESSKVVALTASVMATEVTDLKAAGFHSLISKPINPD